VITDDEKSARMQKALMLARSDGCLALAAKLLERVAGRIELHRNNARSHPDAAAREFSRAAKSSYELVMADIIEMAKDAGVSGEAILQVAGEAIVRHR